MEIKNVSEEVMLFYNFFIGKFEVRDLMFFLYIRSLIEKELNIVIIRLNNSVDSRSLKLSIQKCFKIARIYFSNAAGDEIASQSID